MVWVCLQAGPPAASAGGAAAAVGQQEEDSSADVGGAEAEARRIVEVRGTLGPRSH